ncbi:MAG TPA: peptide ABC transporter substrate-binding protein [Roseiflexaceae bacterium]|nr:peptide ABC transporter substrate-binding protein [Roseiflexaceae bacterium]
MMHFKLRSKLSLLMLLVLVIPVLAACSGTPATTTPTNTTNATAAATAATEPTAATTEPTAGTDTTAVPEPTTGTADGPAESPINDKTLVIGLNQPPDTLFALESQSSATTQVVWGTGACVANSSYDYQTTYCFDEFPTLENGGTVSETVTIDAANVSTENPIVVAGSVVTDATTVESLPASLPQFTITYKLDPDLKWEDGTPVTAKDFVLGWSIQKEPGIQLASTYTLDRIWTVEAPDDTTLVYTMAPGYTDFNYYVVLNGPLPSHLYEGKSLEEVRTAESTKPFSFGPYIVQENVPNESTTLVSNPYFQPQPKIGTIIYKYVTDADQLLAQLESGDVDLLGSIVLNLSVSPKLDELAAAGTLEVQYVPATVWEHFDFGVERGDGQPSFFDDVKVRQAVAHAINRTEIIDKVLYGKTVPMNVYVPAEHPAFPASGLNEYPFDQEKAKTLLTEAGWTAGADGILEKEGRKFSITLYTTEGNPTRQAVAEVAQQNLKDVGIDVKLEFVAGPSSLFLNGEEGILAGRRFDLAMYAWVSGVDPSHNLYLCEGIPTAENGYVGQNNPGWCNPEFDRVAKQALGELDKTKRMELDKQAMTIFNTDLPAFPLYQRLNIIAFNPKVENVKLDPTNNVDLYNIQDIDITE